MRSVKMLCIGSACCLASAIAWAQTYSGGSGGTFDPTLGQGTFFPAWIAPTSNWYGGNIAENYPWNFSITSATPGTPGNIGSVYQAGVWLIPNFIVSTATGTTRYSLAFTYGGLDLKAQLTFNLSKAVPLNFAGTSNSAGCKPGFPTTAGQTWQATYQTVNSSGQTGTKQMTWLNQGFTTVNNQTAMAVQETEVDASGTSQRITYYQPVTYGWLKLGKYEPATPTAPLIQSDFSPPPTVFANNLNVGSSNFYSYTEIKTSGSLISTTPKISTLTFAGIKSVTTPAGPFSACVWREMWAASQPSSVIDWLYDAVSGGLIRRDRNGVPVDQVTAYSFK